MGMHAVARGCLITTAPPLSFALQHWQVRTALRAALEDPGTLPSRAAITALGEAGASFHSTVTGSIADAAAQARAATWALSSTMEEAASRAFDYVQSPEILAAGGIGGVHPDCATRELAVATFKNLGHIPWKLGPQAAAAARAEREAALLEVTQQAGACKLKVRWAEIPCLPVAQDLACQQRTRCGAYNSDMIDGAS